MRALVIIVPALTVVIALAYSATTGERVSIAVAIKAGITILFILAALGHIADRANSRNDYIPPRPRDEW